jgi:RNA-directed DNA polymerase
MESITAFITGRLKLKVNQEKSAVARSCERKFLGFGFANGKRQPKRRIAPRAIDRFKNRVRELTRHTRGVSLERMVADLALYLGGWQAYFGHCEIPSVLQDRERWIRPRLRSVQWKLWKRSRKGFTELRKRGVDKHLAAKTAVPTARGTWRTPQPWR